jgi:hypothetical protein
MVTAANELAEWPEAVGTPTPSFAAPMMMTSVGQTPTNNNYNSNATSDYATLIVHRFEDQLGKAMRRWKLKKEDVEKARDFPFATPLPPASSGKATNSNNYTAGGNAGNVHNVNAWEELSK